MSRIGKQPVPVPKSTTVTIDGQNVFAKGPKGEANFTVHDEVTVAFDNDQITVKPKSTAKTARQKYGMSRTVIANLIHGVSSGFQKTLDINGVGYRAQASGKALVLSLGYSHEVNFPVPDGVTITTPRQTEIVIEGIDKQLVGQIAANIREWRPPEPYKGKGIKHKDEYIFRKEGKKK